MQKFRLNFISSPAGVYGKHVYFAIVIEAEDHAAAHLIGTRMRGEPSWNFQGATAAD